MVTVFRLVYNQYFSFLYMRMIIAHFIIVLCVKWHAKLQMGYMECSLLNSEDKVFERLVFKYLYNHLRDNNILTSLQSCFIPGDSTVNQLTYLYDTICQALDNSKEVHAVFCHGYKQGLSPCMARRSYSQTWGSTSHWRCAQLVQELSLWQETKSCSSWCFFRLDLHFSWCPIGINPGTITVSTLH